jgi:thioredoxin 1|tara:strand:+ start:112 stop:432 length:321 start_codon:yes stop_codon:yes gene_type:complete
MPGLQKSTDDTYKDLMKKDKVVIFKMSATWCNPCKVATEVCLSYLEKNPNVKIYDHDVDSNPNFGTTLGTKGLPTFYCFVDGELKGQLVGSVPESKFAEFVAQHSS